MQTQFTYLLIDLLIIPSTFNMSSIQSIHCVWHARSLTGRWRQVYLVPAAEVLLVIFLAAVFWKIKQRNFRKSMLVLLNVHESAHDGFWIVKPLCSGDLLLVFSFLGALINMLRFRHVKGTQENVLQILYFSRILKEVNILSLEIQRRSC